MLFFATCLCCEIFFFETWDMLQIFFCNMSLVADFFNMGAVESSLWSVCNKGLVSEPFLKQWISFRRWIQELAPDYLIKSPSNGPGGGGHWSKIGRSKGVIFHSLN